MRNSLFTHTQCIVNYNSNPQCIPLFFYYFFVFFSKFPLFSFFFQNDFSFFPTFPFFLFIFFFQNYLCRFYFLILSWLKISLCNFFPLKYCELLWRFPTWFFYFIFLFFIILFFDFIFLILS